MVAGSGAATALQKAPRGIKASSGRIDEDGVRRLGGVELGPELLRRPQVVVVEKLIQRPRASKTPLFRAAATPPGASLRSTRSRGSAISVRRSAVSSLEPSSTTITSWSTSSCSSAEGNAAVDRSLHRLLVGMTTEMSQLSGT